MECWYNACIMGAKTPNIEEQLRDAIRNSGLSRYRLSKLTGVSDGLLANFVNCKRSVTMTTAAKLAEALGLELTPAKRARKER